MSLTAYCKKCREEVEPGEICPRCGTRLGKNAAHAVWCVRRVPAKDWMSWNSVTRILLPAALALILAVPLAELVGGGPAAAERLLQGSFLPVVGILLAALLALTFLDLLLQGEDLVDYTVDNRGIHETVWLPDPTPLKLLARLKSPSLMKQAAGENPVLKLEERSLNWSNTARVQLWPEKCVILYYAPAWWSRVSLYCTPFTWEDALAMTREKLGKKKKIRLPDSLRVTVAPAGKARQSTVPADPEPDIFEESFREAEPAPAGSASESTSSEGQISMDI